MDPFMCLFKRLCTLALLTVMLVKTARTHADDFDELTATDMIFKINQAEHVDDSLFEGDIKLASDQDEPPAREKRAARRDRRYIWTGKTIPYEISDDLMRDGYEPNIKAAIQEIHAHTCLRWKPRENEARWISFQKLKGCWSYVGMIYSRKERPQNISLGEGCNHTGIIMHEMLHASGFWHEQSRSDRDKYVKILWENIISGKEVNFRKHPLQVTDTLNESYDLASIMHYGSTAFSRNYSQPTIQVIGDPNKQIGQRNGLSQLDIAQLNALYDCSGPNSGWSTWSTFGPCDSQCTRFRQRFCASNDTNNCPGADICGVETHREKCTDQKCDGPYDCEFETAALCTFTLCNKISSLWRRRRGNTPSPGTGPMADHTSGNGYYLYFEASSPAEPQQMSCFFSEDFPGGLCQTLTFWYHMFGSGMGEFKVVLKDTAGTETTVWQKSGDQGDKWIQASIEIQSDSMYKVYFVGIRGDSFRSDIAIDDLSFKPCSTHPTTSLLTSTEITSTKATTPGESITDCLEWEAVDNQCEKCSDGGGGPIQIRRKCRKAVSCDYVINEEKETMDCVTYCDGSSHSPSVALILLLIIASAVSLNMWE